MNKNLQLENFLKFFCSKISLYLSLGLHKGCTSYRRWRSLQPSKENIPALQNMKSLYLFLYLGIILALLDLDRDPATPIDADPDSDPQPWICILFVIEYNVPWECRAR
jgi:hypothetical protein